MDFGLVFNLVIGVLALLRVVLFAVFYRIFDEPKDVHPIYRQAAPLAVAEPEPLHLEQPVVRAA
jgi:hypothetical protein